MEANTLNDSRANSSGWNFPSTLPTWGLNTPKSNRGTRQTKSNTAMDNPDPRDLHYGATGSVAVSEALLRKASLGGLHARVQAHLEAAHRIAYKRCENEQQEETENVERATTP